MGEQPLLPGRPYWLKIGTRTVSASVTEIKHKIDVNTQEQLAAKHLELNEVGYCNLYLDQRDRRSRPTPTTATLGGFILIDRQTNATVAAGTLDFALRRAGNIHWQHVDVDKAARARSKGQRRAACGSPACPARASRPSPTWSRSACTRWATTPTCSTATTSATASTRTWASPTRTGSRTSAASPKWPS